MLNTWLNTLQVGLNETRLWPLAIVTWQKLNSHSHSTIEGWLKHTDRAEHTHFDGTAGPQGRPHTAKVGSLNSATKVVRPGLNCTQQRGSIQADQLYRLKYHRITNILHINSVRPLTRVKVRCAKLTRSLLRYIPRISYKQRSAIVPNVSCYQLVKWSSMFPALVCLIIGKPHENLSH